MIEKKKKVHYNRQETKHDIYIQASELQSVHAYCEEIVILASVSDLGCNADKSR